MSHFERGVMSVTEQTNFLDLARSKKLVPCVTCVAAGAAGVEIEVHDMLRGMRGMTMRGWQESPAVARRFAAAGGIRALEAHGLTVTLGNNWEWMGLEWAG